MTDYILAYYQAIKSGEITVGKFILAIYEIIVTSLERGDYYFNIKKANKAIKFIENFCRHCEGRSDLIQLELWQKATVSLIFGIVDENNIRIFREVVLVIGRKNGKTLFASAIIAYMTYLDGEYGAKVYCIAPKLDQAHIVYDNFYQMIEKEPELSSLAKKRRSDVYIAEYNTVIKPIAFNAKKSDGFNPHLVVCDEFSSWRGDAGLKQYEVMTSALGARTQPLVLSISTAGYENNGIYDELIKRSTRFLKGDSKEKRLLPLLYMIDDVEKWNDINELKKSNPNLGVSVSADFLIEQAAIAEQSLSKKAEFLTKYCNIKQNSSQAMFEYTAIERLTGHGHKLEEFTGCYCVGGIDLSQTTDLTACCVIVERGNKLYVISQFFMPSEKIEELTARDGVPYDVFVEQGVLILVPGSYVDYDHCFKWFLKLIKDYKVYPLQVGYDRYSAQSLVTEMERAGFHMDDVIQGENLSPVLQECEGLVGDKKIYFDNNLLMAHFLNVAKESNVRTRKCRPVKISQEAHIDGFVAVLDALTVRQKWYAKIGKQLKNEKKGAFP